MTRSQRLLSSWRRRLWFNGDIRSHDSQEAFHMGPFHDAVDILVDGGEIGGEIVVFLFGDIVVETMAICFLNTAEQSIDHFIGIATADHFIAAIVIIVTILISNDLKDLLFRSPLQINLNKQFQLAGIGLSLQTSGNEFWCNCLFFDIIGNNDLRISPMISKRWHHRLIHWSRSWSWDRLIVGHLIFIGILCGGSGDMLGKDGG